MKKQRRPNRESWERMRCYPTNGILYVRRWGPESDRVDLCVAAWIHILIRRGCVAELGIGAVQERSQIRGMLRKTKWTNWRGEAHSDIAAVSLFTGMCIIHLSGEASSVNTCNLFQVLFSVQDFAAFCFMSSTHNSVVELFCRNWLNGTPWISLSLFFVYRYGFQVAASWERYRAFDFQGRFIVLQFFFFFPAFGICIMVYLELHTS